MIPTLRPGNLANVSTECFRPEDLSIQLKHQQGFPISQVSIRELSFSVYTELFYAIIPAFCCSAIPTSCYHFFFNVFSLVYCYPLPMQAAQGS